MSKKPHKLSIGLQAEFFARLNGLRSHFLGEALRTAITALSIKQIDQELQDFVEPTSLKFLAAQGLRGELFFMVPSLLRAKPSLLGYYRLLYGFSQKEFYAKGPYGRFKSLEERGAIAKVTQIDLDELCKGMNELGADLLGKIGPIEKYNLNELQLLTLGPQFRGGQNTQLGQIATREVFELVHLLLKKYVIRSSDKKLEIKNTLGRRVVVEFSSDPDIRIVQVYDNKEHPLVSVEIKGGADISNVHNRLGEAEKSHQKARARGFSQFWTISRAMTSAAKSKEESPTTTYFFDLDQILEAKTKERKKFVLALSTTLGVRA